MANKCNSHLEHGKRQHLVLNSSSFYNKKVRYHAQSNRSCTKETNQLPTRTVDCDLNGTKGAMAC